MALANANICDFGWKARDFTLEGVDGKTWSLADIRGPKGTLVAFICNHCPYVKAVIGRLVEEANALREIGIGTIAIMSNDTESHPQDSFENMTAFARQHGFTFPYVIDSTQEVAPPTARSARPTSSVSTRRMNCSIEAGWTRRARRCCRACAATSTKP
jgi:peroxiredoxin